MRSVQQLLTEIRGDQEKPLTCRAEDKGWNGYIACLEESDEWRTCGYRMSFGGIFLCDNPARIEQERGK